MTSPRPMRDFGLEVFFSRWEFSAKHHMTASDMESMTISDLLSLGTDQDRQNLESLWLGYTETYGAPDLRVEIASTYETLQPQNILCLAGAGEGLYTVARTLLTADDHAIVPTPNYQSAETIPLAICEVTGVPLHYEGPGNSTVAKGGWRLDIDEVRAAIRPNTRLISINCPQNPTGHVLPRDDVDALISLCREHGIYLFSDEVYRGVELDSEDRMPQLADVYEKAISLNVMSKAYGMPGLRIGWVAMQDTQLLQRIERYKHYLSICNSAPAEVLAGVALRARDQILDRNRQLMVQNAEALEDLLDDFPDLIEWARPLGGCVAFPRYLGPDGVETFCRKLVEESSILLLPSSIYHSDLCEVPSQHFRLGIGRGQVFKDGLVAMREHFETHYPEFRA